MIIIKVFWKKKTEKQKEWIREERGNVEVKGNEREELITYPHLVIYYGSIELEL